MQQKIAGLLIFITGLVATALLALIIVVVLTQQDASQQHRNTDNTPTPSDSDTGVTSFEECVAAGNPVMESYPRQCRANGTLFVEEGEDLISTHPDLRLEAPQPFEVITSPLTIRGEARGSWFFEASFPIVLTNWDGLIIAESYATAQDDWMTTDFVPFEATLEFDTPEYGERGFLILKKDNPSGLPEHDAAYEIPVTFVTE